jgi:mRNA-degrading endonuclease RelE of RelBE toxin-antitoxin system
VPAGQKPWAVELHRSVGKFIARCGISNPRFSPTLGELVDALEANPKQFPKKKGKLKSARAANLTFQNVAYRAVFILDENEHRVLVVALDEHDKAYDHAERRVHR